MKILRILFSEFVQTHNRRVYSHTLVPLHHDDLNKKNCYNINFRRNMGTTFILRRNIDMYNLTNIKNNMPTSKQ